MRIALLGIAALVASSTSVFALTINGRAPGVAQSYQDDVAEDNESPGQWVPDLQGSIGSYLKDGGVVVGTSSLYLAGKPALFVFVQRGDALYRCVDLYTESFEATAYVCYGLKSNPRDAK